MKIARIKKYEQAHFQLLLLADPNRHLIEQYLKSSFGFEMLEGENLIGLIVLTPIDQFKIELKNLAIDPKYQHQGYAQKLIQFVTEYAAQRNYHEMVVGTGTTSFVQLYLYQKMNFRCFAVKTDFFIDNYSKPIFENGLQLRDMLLLHKNLLK